MNGTLMTGFLLLEGRDIKHFVFRFMHIFRHYCHYSLIFFVWWKTIWQNIWINANFPSLINVECYDIISFANAIKIFFCNVFLPLLRKTLSRKLLPKTILCCYKEIFWSQRWNSGLAFPFSILCGGQHQRLSAVISAQKGKIK